MTAMVLQALLLQCLLPLMLLLWSARGRKRSRFEVLGRSVLVFAVLLWLHLVLHWLILPRALSWLWLALAMFILATNVRRSVSMPTWGKPWRAVSFGLSCLVMAVALGQAVSGWWPQAETVRELSFPLRDGRYYVANGGSNALLNPHFKTLGDDPAMERWRGQSHGVDIVALGPIGLPADWPLARDPSRYRIFGRPVLAPCGGSVRRVVDRFPDLPVPEMDKRNLPGNYVLLGCGDVEVVLAHLRQGSIRVIEGQAVQAGHRLGQVGNSGNSSQPHLHIHMQTPGHSSAPLSGEPLVFRFDGDFPVRNEIFRR